LEKEFLNEEQKKERLQKIIDLQNDIALKRAKLMVGQSEKILLEKISRKNSGEWVGKTGNFKKAIVKAQSCFREGMYVDCVVEGVKGHTLLADVAIAHGELIDEACGI
jgi:tRNA-2-methylthio-N6-dimethylallyladenosine synthase